METKAKAFEFFYQHAPWGYRPTETPETGRQRCAKALAEAEAYATDAGYRFRWEIDHDLTSEDFCDDPNPWCLWICYMLDPEGTVVANLGGVDFGRDVEPWGNPYARVVEAELASDLIDF
jgi:hypothetical protein